MTQYQRLNEELITYMKGYEDYDDIIR